MDRGADDYRRFLDGDEAGFVQLVRQYKDGLILYLNSYVNDILTAEELTEETFVKLVLKRPRFLRKSSFKTWLYAIARNVALDHLKRNKRIDLSLDDCPEISADEESLERSCIRQEEKILLHRALRKLKPEYRQILWLIYFEGFTHRDAARIMRRSTHSAETLAYRARQALKAKLLEEGYVYEKL